MTDSPKITAEDIMLHFDMTVLTVPGKQLFSIGDNCQDIMVNGTNLAPLIRFCHSIEVTPDLPALLSSYLNQIDNNSDNKRPKTMKAHEILALIHPSPGKHHTLLKPLKNPPTLAGKVFAATQLSILGMHHTGIRAQAILMWPQTQFNEHDVKLVAAKILTSVQTALLLTLSPEQTDQIWTDQDEYLSFVSTPELPDDNHPTE
jgi:hypothetical protein